MARSLTKTTILWLNLAITFFPLANSDGLFCIFMADIQGYLFKPRTQKSALSEKSYDQFIIAGAQTAAPKRPAPKPENPNFYFSPSIL